MTRELLTAALSSKWAITREAVPALLAQIRSEIAGTVPQAYYDRPAPASPAGPVAVIRIVGGISHRASWWCGTSVEWLKAQFRAAVNDDAVTAIVFDCDSPGGTVDGVPEFAAEIFKARGRKPILAVSNTMMCSAAYWICAQADEVIVSPSSASGSIGVFCIHEDVSKMLETMGVKIEFIFAGEHKVDGNPYEPLGDEARADLQKQVDTIHGDFLSAVAKGRGTTAAAVRKAYGEGRVYQAKEAVALGLANRVGTLDEVVAKLLGKKAGGGMRVSTLITEIGAGLEIEALEIEAAAAAGCGCSPDCPCASGDGKCEWQCPTCNDKCGCPREDSADAKAAAEAAQIAADADAAAAAIAIMERL